MLYLEVKARFVPYETRAVAVKALEECAADLGIERPELKWFSEETSEEADVRREEDGVSPFSMAFQHDDENVGGMAQKAHRIIWLSARLADYPPEEVARIVAHETAHLRQGVMREVAEDEAEAEHYADSAVKALRNRIQIWHKNAQIAVAWARGNYTPPMRGA